MSKSYSERLQDFLLDNFTEENTKEVEADSVCNYMQYMMLNDLKEECFNNEKTEKEEKENILYIDFKKYNINPILQSKILKIKQKLLNDLK